MAPDGCGVALIDLKGGVVDHVWITPTSREPESVLRELADAASARLEAVGVPRDRLLGVGVAVSGVVNPTTGVVRFSSGLGWADVPVLGIFEAKFGPRVFVENAMRAAAVAEMLLGAAAAVPAPDLVVVHVTSVIGSAFVFGGRIYHGMNFASGQLGHIIVSENGLPCACHRRGCLDTVASGHALLRAARAADRPFDSQSALIEAARQGEPFARQLLDGSARAVGQVIGNLTTVLSPAIVALGGPLLDGGDFYLDRVRATAREWTLGVTSGTQIVRSGPGNRGSVAAAALPLEALVYSSALNHHFVHRVNLSPPIGAEGWALETGGDSVRSGGSGLPASFDSATP